MDRSELTGDRVLVADAMAVKAAVAATGDRVLVAALCGGPQEIRIHCAVNVHEPGLQSL